MTLHDGVDTLRFGGVDTTYNPLVPNTTTTSDTAVVSMGLPPYGGTRIIIDKAVSSTQQFTSTTPASGTTPASTTTTTLQFGVNFVVSGRLNLFQANEIDGDAAHAPGQFIPTSDTTTTRQAGGTSLVSATADTQPFFPDTNFKGAVSGQMGVVRVGGNATNFTTLVIDGTGGSTGSPLISNYTVGGETKNVMLVAPGGARDLYFGKGMDTVQVATHVVNTLQSNRGAINSTVQVDRQIGRVQLGGDVVKTTVLSGVQQNFATILATVEGSAGSIFGSTPPNPIPAPIAAQPDGGMSVQIAGDVVDSVFAASTQPINNVFGNPAQLLLTAGHINAKVEGSINNANATPKSPNQAFYAQHVQLFTGPVVPPTVPEAPFTSNPGPYTLPGVTKLNLQPTATLLHQKSVATTPAHTTPVHAKTVRGNATPQDRTTANGSP
jgi:hypothetical protein